jgi:hypothetical protein
LLKEGGKRLFQNNLSAFWQKAVAKQLFCHTPQKPKLLLGGENRRLQASDEACWPLCLNQQKPHPLGCGNSLVAREKTQIVGQLLFYAPPEIFFNSSAALFTWEVFLD